MKFNKKVAYAFLIAPAALLAACNSGGNDDKSSATSEGGDKTSSTSKGDSTSEKITIWTSETEGVAPAFKALAEEYAKTNNLNYTFEVVGMSEKESATKMLTDVSSGADIFCFAQDQFARLVVGSALNKLGAKASEFVKENNTADSVAAASMDSDIYAYPLTADNGYFMYYDKSAISEDHIGSLEDILSDCDNAGKLFSMQIKESGWYGASFFMSYPEGEKSSLCHSTWTTDKEGNFTSVDDTYDTANGIIAAKGFQTLVKSEQFYDSSDAGTDFAAATPSAVVVSGTWDYAKVKEILGDNMGVAPLPSYTVGGKKYHMGSYSGYKLMGVKPQSDPAKSANLHKIAQYLTNYDAQMSRLETFGWGPSNKQAQASDEYKTNPALVALSAQNVYSTPQGQIPDMWWQITKTLGAGLESAELNNETAIKAVLDTYKNSIDAIITGKE